MYTASIIQCEQQVLVRAYCIYYNIHATYSRVYVQYMKLELI